MDPPTSTRLVRTAHHLPSWRSCKAERDRGDMDAVIREEQCTLVRLLRELAITVKHGVRLPFTPQEQAEVFFDRENTSRMNEARSRSQNCKPRRNRGLEATPDVFS